MNRHFGTASAAVRSVVVMGLAVVALVMSAFVMFVAPATVARAMAPEVTGAGQSAELEDDGERVAQPGEVISHNGWDVRVGEVDWGRKASVRQATRHPDARAYDAEHDWAIVHVTAVNRGGDERSFARVTVSLNDTGHRAQWGMAERQTVPGVLDEQGFRTGESRAGNVAWYVPAGAKDEACTLTVTIRDSVSDRDPFTQKVACTPAK